MALANLAAPEDRRTRVASNSRVHQEEAKTRFDPAMVFLARLGSDKRELIRLGITDKVILRLSLFVTLRNKFETSFLDDRIEA